MPPETPAAPQNQDPNFDYLDHPTLGKLAFPKEMSADERNESVHHLIVKKYDLPEDTDLNKEWQQQKTLPKDVEKFSRAWQEWNPPQKEKGIERILGPVERFFGLGHAAREATPMGGVSTVGEMLQPEILAAGEAAAYPAGAAVRGTLRGIARGAERAGLFRELPGRAPRSAAEMEELAARKPEEVAAPKPLPAAAEVPGTIPPVPKPPTPSADVQLNAVAQRVFGKPYDALTSEQQVVVARRTGGAPGGIERRVTQGEAPIMERRAEAMPLPTEARVPLMATPTATLSPIARPGPAGEAGTLPRIGPPPAPPPVMLGGPRTLSQAVEQATGTAPQRLIPNVPLREQLRPGAPVTEPPDPFKAEFPDPAIRRFARANGAELLRSGAKPEVVQAVHDLTNTEVRQAAINADIDVGQKHVGSRTGLGPEQVTRQDLIDQMIKKGIKPEDIPAMAKPKTQPIPLAGLKEGDTFVDETGEPRRIVEITKTGKIKTADGSARTYQGQINSQGPLNSPRAQLARGGKFIPGPGEQLPHVPPDLARHLEPDEVEFLQGRPQMQRNVAAAYDNLKPSQQEVQNAVRAGHGLGGWWQRFIDTFEALGDTNSADDIKHLGPEHTEALKAMHGAVSGNKPVEMANTVAWGVYRDWLEAGRPTDLRSINNIVKDNRGVSGRGGLDTQKVFKLVNSPQFKQGVPFTGEAFVRSPVEGTSPGAKKIPSMVATTAGKGNLKRVVFDTHMKNLYGINNLSDAQYLAASIHIRQAAEALGYAPGEAQEQMWGTVLGLKQLLGTGLSPRRAAQAYGKDVLASVGKDYARVIQDSMADPEVREIMEDLKKFGFDPGGSVASKQLQQIVEQGAQRMASRARPVNRELLARTARRIFRAP